MKKGVFLFVVIAFAILSSLVFYLDYARNCGSVPCTINYLTGNVVFEPQVYPLPPTSTGNEGNSITSFFNNLINTILGPFIGGTVQLGPSHILTPGSEWSGLTTVPPAIGSSGMVGFDAPPIAMWDMVPFQELSGSQTMNVGVMAYHVNGIEKVSFSVDNGPWVDVTTPTLNPQTGVVEYWAVLDASLFGGSNELAEVRAIVTPLTAGQTKVLQKTWSGNVPDILYDTSMVFNINPTPAPSRYVSNSGTDSANCGQTISTPCLTITAALDSADNAVTGTDIGGTQIKFLNGRYVFPHYPGSGSTTTRWVTFTSAENANPNNVLLDGFVDYTNSGALHPIMQVHVYNASLVHPMKTPAATNQINYVWLDHLKMYFENWTIGYLGESDSSRDDHWTNPYYNGAIYVSRGYVTDSYVNNSVEGVYDNILVRNVFNEFSGWGWGGSFLVINYTTKSISSYRGNSECNDNIDRDGDGFKNFTDGDPGCKFLTDNSEYPETLGSLPDFHGDVFPRQGGNTIVYGGGTVPGGKLWSRGIVDISGGQTLSNMVFDGVFLDLDEPYMPFTGWVWSFCNNLNNVIVKDSTLIGANYWCNEGGGTISLATVNNILFQDSTFNFHGDIQPAPLYYVTMQLLPSPNVRYITTPATPPTTPTGLSVGSATPTSLTISWNDVSGETSYTLQYKPTSSSTWTDILLPQDTSSYQHNGLASSTSYDYRIFATNGAGSSATSSVQSGSTLVLTIPPTPTGLTVSALSSTQLRVTWNNVPTATSYKLQRRVGTTGSFTDVAGATNLPTGTVQFDDSGLSSSTQYQYQIQASNGAGSSSFSTPASGSTTAPGACNSITQYGVTWTFTPTTCGQFANGDWWVLEPVTIQTVSPTPTYGANGRHGSWINPRYQVGSTGEHARQPFDARLNAATGPFTDGTYDSSLGTTFPITFNSGNYPSGASLVSSISQAEGVSGCISTFSDGSTFNTGCVTGPIKVFAVLTALNSTPPTDAFRPSYNGVDKTIKFTKSNLDYSKLGSITPSGSITSPSYSIANVNRHIQRVNLQTSFLTQSSQAADNANGYGRDAATDWGIAGMLLNLNSYTNSQKEPLMISLVQIGIDFYGVYMNSVWNGQGTYNVVHNRAAWWGWGGLQEGTAFPILFAGTVLNDDSMKNAVIGAPNDFYFSELAQTFYVENYAAQTSGINATKDLLLQSSGRSSCPGGVNCGRGGYLAKDIGLPEFGSRHYDDFGDTDPQHGDSKTWLTASYRRCCTANSWGGFILVAQAMNMTKLWNSQALFDYMDRYMNLTHSTGPAADADWIRGWDPTLYEMWDARRNQFGCIWTRNTTNDIYSQGYYNCGGQNIKCPGMTSTQGTLVTTCAQYPNQRAIDYNPCNFACISNPSFSFTTSTSGSTSVSQGSTSSSVPITFTHTGGTPASVTPGVTGLPVGVTPSFGSSCTPSIGGSCQSSVTFTVGTGVAVAEYPITITGTSGANVASTPFNLMVTSGAPPTPTLSTITVLGTTSLRATWNNVLGETGYRLERSLSSSGPYTTVSGASNLAAGTTQFDDTGLSSNTQYFYRVIALNGILESSPSSPMAGITQAVPFDFSVTSNPTSGTAIQGASAPAITVSANWVAGDIPQAVTFSAISLPSGVSANFNPGSCTPVIGSSCTSTLTLTASSIATPITNDAVTIRGINGATTKTATYTLTVAMAPPTTPTGLSVGSPTSSSLTINWVDVSTETSYELQRRQGTSGTFTTIATPSANQISYVDNNGGSGLTPNTLYQYQIRATNSGGSSLYTAPVSGTTSQFVPAVPTGLILTVLDNDRIRINWNDVIGETSYTLQRSLTGTVGSFSNVVGAASLAADSTQFIESGLDGSTTYYYRIASFNGALTNGFSSSVFATTQQDPAHVFTLGLNPTSGTVQQGSFTSSIITATYVSGTVSPINFSATNLPSGVSAGFSPTSCTPSSGTCTTTMTLTATGSAQIISGRQVTVTGSSWLNNVNSTYTLTTIVPPICTNGQTRLCPLQQGVCQNSQETCTLSVWPGCNYGTITGYAAIETGVALCNDGLDNDCDGTMDMGGDSGCPLPQMSSFTPPPISTNLLNIPDMTNVSDLTLVVIDKGVVHFRENVNLWRLVGSTYSAINLDDAVKITSNSISVDSANYPELNVLADILIGGLNYNETPIIYVNEGTGPVICPATLCSNINYNPTTGILGVTVEHFSTYTTQPVTCGDTVCSASETCSVCSQDCGVCAPTTGGSSGGSSGGGGSGGSSGGRPRPTAPTQCNDGLDNDGDNLVDYPYDLGCSSVNDNNELDESGLGTNESNEGSQTQGGQNTPETVTQIGVIFWIILVVLLIGIITVGVIIANHVYKRRKLQSYLSSLHKN
jgi:hypothetical protein